MVSCNLHAVVRSGTMWMVLLSYTWVSYLAPLCIWYPSCEFSLRSRSPLYSISMTFRKSFILLLIFCWPITLRTPSCQVVNALSWAFLALLSFMPASLTLHFSHIARACPMSSHAEPSFISFAGCFPFTKRGFSPECQCPTHVLALSIGMFHYLELVYFPLWHLYPPSL